MATAILDLNLRTAPSLLKIDAKYDKAVVLARVDGHAIARLLVPAKDGAITRADILARLDESEQSHLNHILLEEALAIEAPEIVRPTATVAVCTRNRADDLKLCLAGILTLPDDGQEILVIDNCPSDDSSRRVVESYPGVRYVVEPRPGLNHARNRALAEATGEVIAFIDDDAVPDHGWLRALLKNYEQRSVACVTGLTMPVELETEAQEAFEAYTTFSRGFRRRAFHSLNHDPLQAGIIGSGVNMSVRRSATLRSGGFDNTLDAGTPTQSGGDHEMFTRLMVHGFKIVYEPTALNWHRHRRSREELEKTVYGYGVGVYSSLTRALIVEREWGAVLVAFSWFRHIQAGRLWRALTRGTPTDRLILHELRGCLHGPFAYWASVRRLRHTGGGRYD